MPKCRICKEVINKESNDWVMPSKNYYYHIKCYNDWKKTEPLEDAEWRPFIYDFLSRDLKVSYNYHMCEKQIDKYLKDYKMTAKGIYFSLKYFYEIKKGDWEKSRGGLGIIPYIYNEACTYWVEQNSRSKNIIAEIESQIRAATQRKTQTVTQQKTKVKKFKVDLSSIAEMEEDE